MLVNVWKEFSTTQSQHHVEHGTEERREEENTFSQLPIERKSL